MRGILPIVAAAALSWGHAVAVARGGAPGPAAADGLVAAYRARDAWASADLAPILGLSADPLPVGFVAAWTGLWHLLFGPGLPVAAAALLPFHLVAATGLWVGGQRLGGAVGGAWALVGGLGAAGVLGYAAVPTGAFPAFACAALATGAAVNGAIGWAVAGGLGAALVAAGGFPGALGGADGGLSGALSAAPGLGPLLERLVALAQPAALLGVLVALLARGDVGVLRLLGAAAAVLAAATFTGSALLALAAVPPLVLAAASLPRRPALALTALATVQIVGFHLPSGSWPARPAALRLLPPPAPLDAPLDWLAARAPADGVATVATFVEDEELHAGLLAVAAAERGLPLRFVGDEPADLGLVLVRPGRPTSREGWRAQLPPATATLPWGDARFDLWDRGLPPESLLSAGPEAAARNHPKNQGLYLFDGEEHGPLLPHASSPAVVPDGAGFAAVFVRSQALFVAASPDGRSFAEPVPLIDERGPILAFDPAFVTLPDGSLRLFAAELVGEDRNVDPAAHPTRIVTWTGPDLSRLVRDPGARLEGLGLVDPSALPPAATPDGRWVLYLTEAGARVIRAFSSDGAHFVRDPTFALERVTVPEALDADHLLVQMQVMGFPVLATVRPSLPTETPTLLELCGTGPARFGDRLYYTRAPEPCPPPIALPERRAALRALLGAR